MKKINQILLAVLIALSITGCEHKPSVETIVNEDGSLVRTISFKDTDSTQAKVNIYGVSSANGWALTVVPVKQRDSLGSKEKAAKPEKKYDIKFTKKYMSAESSNKELNPVLSADKAGSDTLFHIESKFEKKFRWFYTYITFSETYKAINRFNHVSPSDYFTPEDYAFIERLPAEGKHISLADSLFLDQLNDRIYDIYATRGFFEEYFHGFVRQMQEHKAEQRWIDSLQVHKEDFFRVVTKDKNDLDEENFMMELADSVKIMIPSALRDLYKKGGPGLKAGNANMEGLIRFMNQAGEGKYTHTIQMPWSVVSSNGDSVAGNKVTWNPPVTKFLLKDYSFQAESRKLNYWAVAVSLLIIAGTIWLFIRKAEFIWKVQTTPDDPKGDAE